METFFKDLLIEIFVPLADGSGRGRIGTGIPIAENRILTARHCLLDPDLDLSADFEIRWHQWRDSGKAPGQWSTVKRDQILYPAPDFMASALDAAVFEHPFVPEVAGSWCRPTARNHATGTRWESEGFPDVGIRDDNSRVAVPLKGETYQCANRATEAWLNVDAPTKRPEDWKGASGCPVMVGPLVAGLLTEVPPGFGGGRVMALPLWRLLRDPAFCAAIDYRTGSDRVAAIKAELERARRDTPIAVGALECFVEERPHGYQYRDPVRPVDGLAEDLAARDAVHLMKHARDAIRSLKRDRPEDAKALADLVQRLLPILYDHTAVDRLCETIDDPDAVLIGFPVATRCAAEVVMAGASGRETRFRSPRKDRELEGALSLPRPPNSGIDANGSRTAESFEEHLRRKLAVGELGGFEQAFYRCMQEFIPETLRAKTGIEDDTLRVMAAKFLKNQAEGNDNRFYYLFELPPGDEARTICLETIRKLKEQFKAVTFMELSADGELTSGEWEDFLPLADILQAVED